MCLTLYSVSILKNSFLFLFFAFSASKSTAHYYNDFAVCWSKLSSFIFASLFSPCRSMSCCSFGFVSLLLELTHTFTKNFSLTTRARKKKYKIKNYKSDRVWEPRDCVFYLYNGETIFSIEWILFDIFFSSLWLLLLVLPLYYFKCSFSMCIWICLWTFLIPTMVLVYSSI